MASSKSSEALSKHLDSLNDRRTYVSTKHGGQSVRVCVPFENNLMRYFLQNRLHSTPFFDWFLSLCVVSNQNQLWATVTLFHPSAPLFVIDQVVHTVFTVFVVIKRKKALFMEFQQLKDCITNHNYLISWWLMSHVAHKPIGRIDNFSRIQLFNYTNLFPYIGISVSKKFYFILMSQKIKAAQ